MEAKLTLNRIKRALSYDSATGIFTRLIGVSNGPVGSVAGCPNSKGYLRISIDRRSYLCHRLAWFYVHGQWPADLVDHINRDPLDNRIENLREASHTQNHANQGLSPRNRHGLKGVSFNKASGKFVANIQINRAKKYLGLFDTAQAAHYAYLAAANREFGSYARAA